MAQENDKTLDPPRVTSPLQTGDYIPFERDGMEMWADPVSKDKATSVLPTDQVPIFRNGNSMVASAVRIGMEKKPLSSRATVSLTPLSSEGSVATGTFTWLLRYPIHVDIVGLRLLLPIAVKGGTTKCFVAKSSNKADDGSGLTWTPVLFGGVASIARTGTGKFITSDMTAISCLSSEYLFVRVVGVDCAFFDSGMGQTASIRSNDIFGDGLAWGFSAGDLGSSGSITVTQNDFMQTQVYGIDLIPKSGVSATIGCVGDSLDSGWNTTGNTEFQRKAPLLFSALQAKSDGINLGYIVASLPGQTHTVSVGNIGYVSNCDFITVRPWSPNGTANTQAHYDKVWSETVDFINTIVKSGAIPILLTSTPVGATGTAETLRNEQNARVLAMSDRFIVADISNAVKDPINPNSLLPAYLDPLGNQAHLSEAGYRKCGEVIYNAIKPYIS